MKNNYRTGIRKMQMTKLWSIVEVVEKVLFNFQMMIWPNKNKQIRT